MTTNEVRFLIVHGKPCEEMIVYYCAPGDWCNNPNHAKRFTTREEAQKIASEMIGSNARVEDHMWCAGPESPDCSPPVAPRPADVSKSVAKRIAAQKGEPNPFDVESPADAEEQKCATCNGTRVVSEKTDAIIPCPVTGRPVGVANISDCPDCVIGVARGNDGEPALTTRPDEPASRTPPAQPADADEYRYKPKMSPAASAADVITTERIVEGLKSIETAVHSDKWNGELVWIKRACRRLTGEDGFSATHPAMSDEVREAFTADDIAMARVVAEGLEEHGGVLARGDDATRDMLTNAERLLRRLSEQGSATERNQDHAI